MHEDDGKNDANPVLLEELGPGVWRLTLNRPARLNAITPLLIEGLHSALDQVDAMVPSERARVPVMTGAGRGFCAGADIGGDWGDGTEQSAVASYRAQQRLSRLALRLTELDLPVIAAVNGPAVGGGLALALAADVRYAAADAFFAVANVRIGLSGGEMGMSYLLPRAVGRGKAAELMFTGRQVGAAEGLAMGLVERVVPTAELDAAVAELVGGDSAELRVRGLADQGDADAGSFQQAVAMDNRTQQVAAAAGGVAEAVAAFRSRS